MTRLLHKLKEWPLWICMVAISVWCVLNLCACSGKDNAYVPDGMLLQTERCKIYSDSMVFDNGMTLLAVGDSLLQVRMDGITLRQMAVPKPGAGSLSVHTKSNLLNLLVRLEQAYCTDVSLPYNPVRIMLNPHATAHNWSLLQSCLKNGYPVPQDCNGKSWPIVNENPWWLAAAFETVACSGNPRYLNEIKKSSEKIIEEDYRIAYNSYTNLFYGLPRHLATKDDYFPAWMQQSDIFKCQTFALNMAYVGAVRKAEDINLAFLRRNNRPELNLKVYSDTIANAVKRKMWMPQQGRFGALIYGNIFDPQLLDYRENGAQALAVATGLITGEMAKTILRDNDGSAIRSASAEENAITAIAGAHTANAFIFNTTIAYVMQQLGNDVITGRTDAIACQPLSIIMLRAIAGTQFKWDALTFQPYVPGWMAGDLFIEFEWRKSKVMLTIKGAGTQVSECMANGIMGDAQIESADLSDTNSVEIRIKETPGSDVSDDWLIITSKDASKMMNEASTDKTVNSLEYQANGFAIVNPELRYHHPASIVRLSAVAHGGTRVVQDKVLAAKFVESSRAVNRHLKFRVLAPEAGKYIVEVHYISGLGIVNAKRGTALRMLIVNDNREGVFVFPQQSSQQWDKMMGDNWQRLTAFSNPLVVNLLEGYNDIELRYFQTTPVYLNPTANDLVADYVRFTPLYSKLIYK